MKVSDAAPSTARLEPRPQSAALAEAAIALEASFIAEMLKSSGLHDVEGSFFGGSGQDQYSSFMLEAQAKKIANAGGLGLSEMLFEVLKDAANER